MAARHKKYKSYSAFGAKTRHNNRIKGKIAKKGLFLICKGKTKMQQSDFLAEACSWHNALPDAFCAAKSVQHSQGLERKRQEADVLNRLRDFDKNQGMHLATKLKDAIPSLPFQARDLIAVPCQSGAAFHLPFAGSTAATKGIGFAHLSRLSNLGSVLEADWVAAHEPVQAKSRGASTGKTVSRCCATGFCVCKGEGQKLWKLRSRVLQNMKSVFYGKDMKALLSSGK
eukprot:5162720-Amphidinium_carterae.1